MKTSVSPAVEEMLATMEMLHKHVIRAFMVDAAANNVSCAKIPVTLHQAHALEIIASNQGLNNKQLAQALQISPASASAMVERLVELNLVKRYIPDEDRRTVKLQPSSKGDKVIQTHRQVLERVISDLLQRLGEKDARRWIQLGRKIRKTLEPEITPQPIS